MNMYAEMYSAYRQYKCSRQDVLSKDGNSLVRHGYVRNPFLN